MMQKLAPEADLGPGSGSGRATPKKPRIDVPFCMQKLKPLWLPIKAHRFTAYRSKVLRLLPQKILAQYVAFEKQGHLLACVKLLESATTRLRTSHLPTKRRRFSSRLRSATSNSTTPTATASAASGHQQFSTPREDITRPSTSRSRPS